MKQIDMQRSLCFYSEYPFARYGQVSLLKMELGTFLLYEKKTINRIFIVCSREFHLWQLDNSASLSHTYLIYLGMTYETSHPTSCTSSRFFSCEPAKRQASIR